MPSNEWDDEAEIRHRAKLLKARGRLAKEPTSAILEALKHGDARAIYADFIARGSARIELRGFDEATPFDPAVLDRLAGIPPRSNCAAQEWFSDTGEDCYMPGEFARGEPLAKHEARD